MGKTASKNTRYLLYAGLEGGKKSRRCNHSLDLKANFKNVRNKCNSFSLPPLQHSPS